MINTLEYLYQLYLWRKSGQPYLLQLCPYDVIIILSSLASTIAHFLSFTCKKIKMRKNLHQHQVVHKISRQKCVLPQPRQATNWMLRGMYICIHTYYIKSNMIHSHSPQVELQLLPPSPYSWVKIINSVTTLWLTCFDYWCIFYEPFITNLAPRFLTKVPAIFFITTMFKMAANVKLRS